MLTIYSNHIAITNKVVVFIVRYSSIQNCLWIVDLARLQKTKLTDHIELIATSFSKMESENFDVSKKTGFLPQEPIQKLGDYFSEWEKAAQSLPQLIHDNCLKETIVALPEKEFNAKTLNTEGEWRWAYVIVSFLAQAYIYISGDRTGSAVVLPSKLAIPWHTVAKHIGVPPVATYAAVVLYNYTLKDPSRTVDADNLQAALTFTGSSKESWFFMVHVLEETAAAPGLEAIVTAYKALSSKDNEALGRSLQTIAESLHLMKTTLAKMYDHCTPEFFYNELRPFLCFPASGILYSGVSSEVKRYRSGSAAQDSAIPAFNIFLGTKHESEEQEILDDFKLYMPAKHREFLVTLGQQPSVSYYVQESGDAELIRSYDEAVDALASFRSRHISLVTSYIINVKQRQGEESSEEDKGTGGTPFMRFLKKVRDNTKFHKEI